MLNVTNTFATVWEPKVEEKFVQANISTSRKNQDETYTNMSWRARFVGKSFEKAQELTDKTRIKINSAICENNYDKDNNRLWVTVVVFDFEVVE